MNKSIYPYLFIVALTIISCSSKDTVYYEGVIPEKIDFNFHIKPILSDRCFACHGPDNKARKADFRLDREEDAFQLLDSLKHTYIIKPGDIDKSELFQRIIAEDEEQRMPPLSSNLKLSNYEKELIKRWIEQGAEWKPHWAFIQPEKVELPKLGNSSWVQNAIDYFILEKLEEFRVLPSQKASKEKLIRRLSFDLTGLPPTPEIIDDFMLDQSDDAYEKVVDQLLVSKSYGERLATDWLDLARYAETNGYHHDFERNMWPWRDWVIQSFNENLSYDQFVTWQLAGDLLPESTYKQKLATGFNRNNRTTQECGSLDEEFRVSYVIDRTNTFGKAFLGLTLECAQCHDHKYDPLSQREYYELSAFFNQVPEKGVSKSFHGQPEPNLELPEEDIKKIQKYIKAQMNIEYSGGGDQDVDKKYKDNWEEEMNALFEPVMVMKDSDTLRPTYILERGQYDSHGEEVSHGAPKSILSFGDDYSSDRLGLAQWLFNRENPLTARVAVNRYWQMIFGVGLVKTPGDFGNQGALPSHPKLLDWLAVEFIESGWNVKKILKLMVMSATYQQSATMSDAQLAFDSENKWLARGSQQRLTAEMLRDQSLKISGLLSDKVGGPSVKPYQPNGLWTQVSSGGRYKRKYMMGHGEDLYRRSLYTYWKRIQPPPSMLIFDAANRNICTVKRQSTNTPLQALVMMNDPQFVEASRLLGFQMMERGGDNVKERLEYGFKSATSRKPDIEEIRVLEDLFQNEMREFESNPKSANEFLNIGKYKRINSQDTIELASYSVVANAIINLSESLQKN